MRKMVDSKCPCDAMMFHSTERMFFCTLSSKKAIAISSLCDYEQSNSSDIVNFTFTGKERDEETGYGYFGARYMDYELLTSFISVDRYASKYPSISPYAYCAWNPLRLIDPNGDSIALSEKAWGIMEQAIKSTLLQKNKNIKNPFYYRDGHVHYDESISFNTNDEKLQEIHNHFKELTTDKNYKVEVDLVSNDTKFDAVIDEEWTQTTLKREGAYGFSQPNQEKNTGCLVYISNHPLHSDGTPYAQSDDFMSLSFLHEVGGHAYNWKNNIYGSLNNRNTEWFERICRDVFKGKYGNSDVHNGKVKIHAL